MKESWQSHPKKPNFRLRSSTFFFNRSTNSIWNLASASAPPNLPVKCISEKLVTQLPRLDYNGRLPLTFFFCGVWIFSTYFQPCIIFSSTIFPIMSHLSFCWTLFFCSLHATCHSKISSPSAKRCRRTKRKALAMRTCRSRYQQRLTVVGGPVQRISHRIHVWNINRTHIWLIFSW